MKDVHYTPKTLAEKLLSYVSEKSFMSIADFCVGNGSLLKSAQKLYKNAEFYGSDISPKVLKDLKESYPHWTLSQCDFTNKTSRSQTKILKENKNGFDLILLNPPFSCKGSAIHEVELDKKIYKVSTSMLFTVESLKYLSESGVLLAILPISVAYSQKDRLIWNKLLSDYNLKILEEPEAKHFKNCSPSIILVSINAEETNTILKSTKHLNHSIENLSLFRGKISMNTINGCSNNGSYLIHSVNLRDNNIVNLEKQIDNKLSEISGPAVLIPRVGTPNPNKIAVIKNGDKYTLSDCIIGIKTKSTADSKKLFNLILDNWDSFRKLYIGTGAKYVTLERLGIYLNLKEQQFTIPSLLKFKQMVADQKNVQHNAKVLKINGFNYELKIAQTKV